MWILPIIGYAGVIVGFSFLTLAIASGLYYLSELVEEHTVLAKKILRGLIYSIIVVQILLTVIDKFPWKLSALSVFSHVVYSQNLRHFPTVKLTDPVFLLSCGLVILNHYLWFSHFQKPPHLIHEDPYHPSRYTSSSFYGQNTNLYDADRYYPTFTEISSYFGICVWLVPFSLFVALSAGENVLPSMGSEYATGEGSSFVNAGVEPGKDKSGGLVGSRKGSGRESIFKAAVNRTREYVSESGQALGLWKGDKSRTF